MAAHLSLLLLGASTAFASPLAARASPAAAPVPATPASKSWTWDAGAVHDYPIHPSCNATQHGYIKKGLEETILLSSQARDHILRWGNSSDIYRKYFGNAPTAEPLGWFTKIVDGDKNGVLFRCDNVDGNCRNANWAGHWRGANASTETVICDLSYETRKPLEALCMFGYDIANGATNTFWASDLLHRLLHIPKVSEGIVEHYGHEGKYTDILAFGKENSTIAVRNSDSLQYFALEAYAHDVAVPGVGCAGTYRATASPTPSATASVSASASKTASTSKAASKTSAVATKSAAAAASPSQGQGACTPHDDHWHCPPGVPVPTSPPA